MELALVMFGLLGSLLQQSPIPTNCVFEFTCLPTNPLDVLSFYKNVFGIPHTVMLGVLLGLLNAGLYIRNRSLTMLAILGTYCIAAVSSVWIAEVSIAPQFSMAIYTIIFGVATAVVVMILKVVKE